MFLKSKDSCIFVFVSLLVLLERLLYLDTLVIVFGTAAIILRYL